VHYLNNVSASVAAVMKPAGFDNAQGIITASYLKDATDKQWDDDVEMKAWRAWMNKWMAGSNQADANHIYGYAVSFLMHETLMKCGDTLTRENVMRQAANHQKRRVPLLLPGILVSTSPTDFYPVQAVQLPLQGRDLGTVRRRPARRRQLRVSFMLFRTAGILPARDHERARCPRSGRA
jgi:branched-chain amino acid transport system substrate-binding protein